MKKLKITGLKVGKSELRNNFRAHCITVALIDIYDAVHNRQKPRDGLYEKGLLNT